MQPLPASSRPTLAVCCVACTTPRRLFAALAGVRAIADEIVVGLDAQAPGRQERSYRRLADRVVRLSDNDPGSHADALLDGCSSDWALRLERGEIPSEALVRRLPALMTGAVPTRWAIRRRWLFPDRAHWIDEAPWAPDFALRLLRVSLSPRALEAPIAYVNEPIYTLDCLVSGRPERQARALVAEVLDHGHRAERRLCDPERYASLAPADVPPEDRPAISRWFGQPVRGAGVIAPAQPPPSFAASPDATIACLERDLRFQVGEHRAVAFAVTNTSASAWPARGAAVGQVSVSYHWRWADDRVDEGLRTPFPVDVGPGETMTLPLGIAAPGVSGTPDLVVDVVEEHVRWYGAQLSLRAPVQPPVDLPDRRPAVLAGGATRRRWSVRPKTTIPRVIHQVWLGGGAPPAHHHPYMESWRDHNPGWQVRLWTDADAPVPAAARRARNLAERADLVRYEILRRHGGVYADTDVECLRSIEPLVAPTRVFAGYEIPGRLCNAVMGGLRGHRAFQRLVTLAERTVGIGDYPSATATVFLTRVLEPEPEATLFGPEVFYPYLWDEPRPERSDFPDSYAVHHWAMSWLPSQAATH